MKETFKLGNTKTGKTAAKINVKNWYRNLKGTKGSFGLIITGVITGVIGLGSLISRMYWNGAEESLDSLCDPNRTEWYEDAMEDPEGGESK